MDRPLVSVIIPVYNRAALLSRALQSVLSQSFEDWELIVVDDGSLDDTPEMVRHWSDAFDGRLRYVRQENRGSSAARNRGIDESRGKFIAFLDSDDEFRPDKLARQLRLFSLRPELGMVYSDYSAVDEQGSPIGRAFDRNCRMAREVAAECVEADMYVCRDSLFPALLRRYFIATIVGMVRREILGTTLRFAEDQWYAEEWLFYLELSRRCQCGFIDAPLSIHHHVRGSVTRTDKIRNSVGAYRIARAIELTFPALSPTERTTLRSELVRTARQLGYDALRLEKTGTSLVYLRETLRRDMSFRSIRDYWGLRARALFRHDESEPETVGLFDVEGHATVGGGS